MKQTLAVILLALSLTAPALAEPLKIPADKPFASVTFPDDWEAKVAGDAITASNEDEDVLIDVIITRPDMLGPSNDKAFALLKVKPDFDSFKENKTTINGLPANVVTVDAKGESGTMKLTLTSLEVTKEKGLMFIQRGEGLETNKDAITAILNSVKVEK
jgi:hypothetical protein